MKGNSLRSWEPAGKRDHGLPREREQGERWEGGKEEMERRKGRSKGRKDGSKEKEGERMRREK